MTPTEIAEKLGHFGLCVCPDFLDADFLRSVAGDFKQVEGETKFRRAGVGQGTHQEVFDSVRQDETYWLSRENSTPVQTDLLDRCAELKTAFNRTLYLGLDEFEGHYASYPAGGFYRRHLDSFGDPTRSSHNQLRTVSIVLYLNEDWQQHDGGRLRVYDGDKHTDIDPVGGTLVCFMSCDSEHEVLPSHKVRRSFAGWFSRKEN